MPRAHSLTSKSRTLSLTAFVLTLAFGGFQHPTLCAQRQTTTSRNESLASSIPPVRVDDHVEVKSGLKWYPGRVLTFDGATASVEYEWANTKLTRDFTLENMRFPNGEGHWMLWQDASGKFKIEARYLSRTATDVTLRKEDGGDTTVPIAALAPALRKQLQQTPITGDENKMDGANPIRVGDQIEVKYFSKWYDGQIVKVLPGQAVVEYQYGSSTRSETFDLEDLRFPNGEGRWREWSDASGEFKIIARYISRTATDVTIRKEDGSDLTIPIDRLSSDIRSLLAKTPVTGEENMMDGANPIRVGDQVQVKYYFTWYDGVVKQVLTGVAKVEFQYGSSTREVEAKLEDIRFPNGEGRWREWSDASGEIKIIARYLYRDDTHVTVRKEDGSDVRVEIARLNPKLRKLLSETPIIAPRPPSVTFASTSARNITLTSVPGFQALAMSAAASAAPIEMHGGGIGFPIPFGDSISTAIAIGGPEQWVAVGTYPSSWKKPPHATQLFWASPAGNRVVEGPILLPDERIVDYSAQQSRLITVQVDGRWDTPKRFCSYRVQVGDSIARAEASWDIPEAKRSTSRQSAYVAKLVGDHQLLLASDNVASLFDFEHRRIEYTIDNLASNHFKLHPAGQHFVVAINDGHSLHEIATGQQVAYEPSAKNSRGSIGFSEDGRYLLRVTSDGIDVWDITQDVSVTSMRPGGLTVAENVSVSLLSGGWIAAGSQIYSAGLKLVVWNYVGSGVTIAHREMLGRQLLAVGTAGSHGSTKTALVGVATVPHQDAVELMSKVDPTQLQMLERGSPIRIEASGNPKIAAGLRRAAAVNGWREDPTSEVIFTGSAQLGKAETRTYQKTSFGMGGGSSIEEHTVQPWIQKAEIRYQDKVAWSTMWGGVPFSMLLREGQSLGSELQKSSNPSYELFEQLKPPEELLYPRYQKGLGTTEITPNGFVDKAN